MNPRPTIRTRRRGFTLIELTVVIGIILLLVGLVVAAGVGVVKQQNVSRTQNALEVLNSAYTEWKRLSGRDITFGIDDVPVPGARYEIQDPDAWSEADQLRVTREVMCLIGRTPQVQEILAALSDEKIKQVQINYGGQPLPSWDLFDDWDRPVYFVPPGRKWVNGVDNPALRDTDGTVRHAAEQILGVAPNQSGYFISAGPNTDFGDFFASADSPARANAEDNIYSVEVERP